MEKPVTVDDALHAPQFLAALDMVRRTGALEVQIRWSDDEEPTVWFVTARHNVGPDRHPRPPDEPGVRSWSVGAALHPYAAAIKLLEELMDGGTCAHCNRPSGVTEDFAGGMPFDTAICWYRFDPELATFRRGCE